MSLSDNIDALAAAVRGKINAMMPRLLPPGGGAGQMLRKASATDYAVEWADPPAGGGGGDPWTYVRLGADFETTSTANSDVTGLAFTPAANSLYEFEGRFFVQAAATTTGARPGIKWPGGTLQEAAWMISPNSATAFSSRFWGAPSTANAAATGVAVANEGLFAQCNGMLRTGPSPTGALQITLATEIAASAARIMANSFLRYRLIP